ncbi:unnamed protein product, partial [Meganyctiphanes norvegica]
MCCILKISNQITTFDSMYVSYLVIIHIACIETNQNEQVPSGLTRRASQCYPINWPKGPAESLDSRILDLFMQEIVYLNFLISTKKTAGYLFFLMKSGLVIYFYITWHISLSNFTEKRLIDHDYWVGAEDESTEGEWRWITGNPVWEGSPYWAIKYESSAYKQEPLGDTDQNCLCLDHLRFYYMDDQSCDEEKPSICAIEV